MARSTRSSPMSERLGGRGNPGAGDPYKPTDGGGNAPTLTGPDRLQAGSAADGADTYAFTRKDARGEPYWERHCALHARIAGG